MTQPINTVYDNEHNRPQQKYIPLRKAEKRVSSASNHSPVTANPMQREEERGFQKYCVQDLEKLDPSGSIYIYICIFL